MPSNSVHVCLRVVAFIILRICLLPCLSVHLSAPHPGPHTHKQMSSLFETEYSFAGQPGAPGSGVFDQVPRSTPPGSDWVFKEQLDLGKTPLSSAQLTSVLSSLRGEFLAKDYDLVGKNCNHFSEMVCDRAKVKFPAWVNRAANVGGMCTGGYLVFFLLFSRLLFCALIFILVSL